MNRKIVIIIPMVLLAIAFASATAEAPVSCSKGATLIAWNPEGTIAVCQDPTHVTCEQDFGTLCPANWHLCSSVEYNAGNDNWQGSSDGTPMLGQIQCRQDGGAGHFSVPMGSGVVSYNADQANNMWAGSSLPQCPSSYGCNEQQYYALCCFGQANPVDPGNSVPEFAGISVALVMAGLVGIAIMHRKN